ncbi:MAG: tRNA dihydrouridine synthase DusB, partial [Polaromonas sp.]|nr:tRNA dihydrouridine synthase DusB [Polaromonas sp.]
EAFRSRMNGLEDSQAQWQAVADFFDALGGRMDRMPVAAAGDADEQHNKAEGELA